MLTRRATMLGTLASVTGSCLGLTPALVEPKYVLEIEAAPKQDFDLTSFSPAGPYERFQQYRIDLPRLFIRDQEQFLNADNVWSGVALRLPAVHRKFPKYIQNLRQLGNTGGLAWWRQATAIINAEGEQFCNDAYAGKHQELARVLAAYKKGVLDTSGVCIFLRASDV